MMARKKKQSPPLSLEDSFRASILALEKERDAQAFAAHHLRGIFAKMKFKQVVKARKVGGFRRLEWHPDLFKMGLGPFAVCPRD